MGQSVKEVWVWVLNYKQWIFFLKWSNQSMPRGTYLIYFSLFLTISSSFSMDQSDHTPLSLPRVTPSPLFFFPFSFFLSLSLLAPYCCMRQLPMLLAARWSNRRQSATSICRQSIVLAISNDDFSQLQPPFSLTQLCSIVFLILFLRVPILPSESRKISREFTSNPWLSGQMVVIHKTRPSNLCSICHEFRSMVCIGYVLERFEHRVWNCDPDHRHILYGVRSGRV